MIIRLFIVFIFLPLTLILLIIFGIKNNASGTKALGYIWAGILLIAILGFVSQSIFDKKKLSKADYYGDYIIDRDYFPGKQADWQYNHFRFTITNNDSIYFYYTDGEYELITYRGTITTTDPSDYASDRLIIKMGESTHHILTSNPTTYRGVWSFFLVFYSPKFNNLYFKKGKWEPIED